MARGSPAQGQFDEVVKRAVTPVLKPIGFRKSGTNFHRRHGEVVQVVNLQSSQGSTWDEKLFYVNVGLAFDALCALSRVKVLETPKEYECDLRGTRGRLETLVEGVPARWSVLAGGSSSAIADQLEAAMKSLVAELERIDSPSAYRAHRWFNRFGAAGVNAQILYVLGDLDGAWHEVKELCRLFADRKNACDAQWWVQRLKLAKLSERLP